MKGDPFWYEKPEILWNKHRLSEFFPTNKMTLYEKLNALCRLSIYVGLVFLFFYQKTVYLFIPIVCLAFTYLIYQNHLDQPEKKAEKSTLVDAIESEKNDNVITTRSIESFDASEGDAAKCVLPTVDNVFGNFNQITDDRDKPAACKTYDNPPLAKKTEDLFMTNLYRDVSDLYGKSNGELVFYQMPSTKSCNDQTAFARWCYLAPPTCKEDSIRCVPYSSLPEPFGNDSGNEYLKLRN